MANLKHNFACSTAGDADLELTKTAAVPEVLTPGTVINYSLKVTNWTKDPAYCVRIEDPVPANTVFNALASHPGWSCIDGAPAGTTCIYDVGTLQSTNDSPASRTGCICGQGPARPVAGDMITNTATAETSTPDSQPQKTQTPQKLP